MMAMRREYRRTKVSAAESAELWERWKKGEGLHAIGQALGRRHTSVFAHIRPSGGIKPPVRRRSVRALTMAEREEISRGIVEGRSVRTIARVLGRSASTVSREIHRNGGLGRYRAAAADKLAWKRALRPKRCKLAICGQLRQAVAAKLKRNWSPEQIAGWLKRTHPANEARRVSHETIYRSLYVQTRGVLKQELMAYCDLSAFSGARAMQHKREASMARSLMPCRSANGRRRSRIAPCRDTGKAICFAVRTTATSSPSLSGIRAM